MQLAIAQINTTVGELEGNVRRILLAAKEAAAHHPDLIAFPELVVCGYPPRDILYDTSFVEAVQAATFDLAQQVRGLPPLLVGSFAAAERKVYEHPSLSNVAYLMQGGEARPVQVKQLLPIYDVFYEPRWFLPGWQTLPPIELAGRKVGILICEDMWDEGYSIHPAADLVAMGAEMLICISAVPYRRHAMQGRLYHAKRQGLPLAFISQVGANDELIFDGSSFVLNGAELKSLLKSFEEEIRVVEFPSQGEERLPEELPETEPEIFKALVLGLRDFARKNGLGRAFVGLSGGIDSSVAAVIAAEALGAAKVIGVAIPSRFTDPRSTESARELASTLGIGFEVVGLEGMHLAAEQALGPERSGGVGGENIQARLRMVILMSFVNQQKGFLVNTSNKTELALGYSTLYGDMAGTISPLGDLTKPEVYALARWINRTRSVIPPFVMERAPSAELKTDQVDPFDYERIAPELEGLVRANQSNTAMRAAEHKRWQMGLVLKVSEKSFGRGRLMPITRK